MSSRRQRLQAKMQRGVTRLPPRFRYTIHNILAHPAGEILYQIGQSFPRLELRLERVEGFFHDGTVPIHKTGTGRG